MNHFPFSLQCFPLTKRCRHHRLQLVIACLLSLPISLSAAENSTDDALPPPPPVDLILERAELWLSGSPHLFQLVANLPQSPSSDSLPELFLSEGLEGAANINLRGLGAGRNRVLLDGLELGTSAVPVPLSGELFVNLNQIPNIALEQMVITTRGAASTWTAPGAITGLVNLHTRSGFEGAQASYSHAFVADSAGEEQLALLWGVKPAADHHLLLALEAEGHNALSSSERSWSSKSVVHRPDFVAPVPAEYCTLAGYSLAVESDGSDDGCYIAPGAFANLNNDDDRYRLFASYELPLKDGAQLHMTALWARSDAVVSVPPSWAYRTTPVPPLPAMHPAQEDFLARNPDMDAADTAIYAQGDAAALFGAADRASRRHQNRHFSFRRQAPDTGKVRYQLEGVVALSDAWISDPQIDSERLLLAVNGYGGPDCNGVEDLLTGSSPGQGCEFYNPYPTGWSQLFSLPNPLLYSEMGEPLAEPVSLAAGNPVPYTQSELDALINSPELLQWLQYDNTRHYSSRLSLIRAVWMGNAGALAGGHAAWQAGASWRRESWKMSSQRSETVGGNRFSRGLFHDWQLPFSSQWSMELSLRLEDYGKRIGDAMLPALAVRWQTGIMVLELAHSRSARAPDVSQMVGGEVIPLAVAADGYSLLVFQPNHELQLEQAQRQQLTYTLQTRTVQLQTQLWQLTLSDAILPAGIEALPEQLQAGESYPLQYVAGGDIDAKGLDFNVRYRFFHQGLVQLTVGLDWSHISSYRLRSSVSEMADVELAGQLNGVSDGHSIAAAGGFRPLPEDNRTFLLNLQVQRHHVRLQRLYRSGYKTAQPSAQAVDDWQTVNLHYFYRYRDDSTKLYISLLNLSDENPPAAPVQLGYDAYNHSPQGQVIKIGVHHNFP